MIYDKQLWALTPDAARTVELMVTKGMDRDLAVAFLELICTEEELYELPPREENVS